MLQQEDLHRGSALTAAMHHVSEVFWRQQELNSSNDWQNGLRGRRSYLQKLMRAAAEVMQARKNHSASASRTMHRFVLRSFMIHLMTHKSERVFIIAH